MRDVISNAQITLPRNLVLVTVYLQSKGFNICSQSEYKGGVYGIMGFSKGYHWVEAIPHLHHLFLLPLPLPTCPTANNSGN